MLEQPEPLPRIRRVAALLFLGSVLACAPATRAQNTGVPPEARAALLDPSHAFWSTRAPDTFRARFETNMQAFLSLAEAAKHYPCIRRAWIEFLGEPPASAADRVDPVPS